MALETHKNYFNVKVIRYRLTGGSNSIQPKEKQLYLDLQTKPTMVTFTNINNDKQISIPLSNVIEIEYEQSF
jgi:hypothetical protein